MDIKQLPEGVVFTYDPSHRETVDALHSLVKDAELEMDLLKLLDKTYVLPGMHIDDNVDVVEWRSPPPELTGWQITTRIDNARRKIARLQLAIDNMKAVLNNGINAWDEAVNKGEFTK